MNSTPKNLIYFVVIAIAILALIGVGSLCASLFRHTYADPAILTAIITMTSLLCGSLVTILTSPRTQAVTGGDSTTQMSSTITTTSNPINGKGPTPVQVINSPTNPVPVEQSK